jgi:hypothetical protein
MSRNRLDAMKILELDKLDYTGQKDRLMQCLSKYHLLKATNTRKQLENLLLLK